MPSQRRKEAQELSKNMVEYSNVKKRIIYENRRKKFAQNRWREGIANVFKMNKESNTTQNVRRRTLYDKYNEKNKIAMYKSTCK